MVMGQLLEHSGALKSLSALERNKPLMWDASTVFYQRRFSGWCAEVLVRLAWHDIWKGRPRVVLGSPDSCSIAASKVDQ